MRYCEPCDYEHTNVTCPRCGGRSPLLSQWQEEHHPEIHERVGTDTYVDDRNLSEVPDRFDTMVEQASTPTLSQLIQRGVDSGLIKPIHDYAQGKKS